MDVGNSSLGRLLFGLTLVIAPAAHASSSFSINPTFNGTITGDANAAAIESIINNVIAFYDSNFVVPSPTPVVANITFGESNVSLGQSSFFTSAISYQNYCNALQAAGTPGSGTLTCGTAGPIDGGDTNLQVKTITQRALNLGGVIASDGTITFDQTETNPDNSGGVPLQAVIEHEIDEMLGLGSSLNNTNTGPVTQSTDPWPEDLFRFSAPTTRNYDVGSTCAGLSASSYFSIDNGTTNLAGFNNACNGGDFGDWDTTISRIQNWQTSGGNPPLGVEITALEAVGFQSAVPEPATFGLIGVALAGLVMARRRAAKR